eukprot:m.62479 g.62479  ORF g.62479 m.62479 type:complete len:142 (+) comp13393_c0_seq1:616-1041(+)
MGDVLWLTLSEEGLLMAGFHADLVVDLVAPVLVALSRMSRLLVVLIPIVCAVQMRNEAAVEAVFQKSALRRDAKGDETEKGKETEIMTGTGTVKEVVIVTETEIMIETVAAIVTMTVKIEGIVLAAHLDTTDTDWPSDIVV